ncbi:cryptochrome/deoxyribodipyrimidine photo-lyase family protein [Hydrogenophaga sp.]|uniref:cryptochrome/deoxyribodipyrimidine photo-lyase family protein n=1 Tax=Hydrogenophaga sp. TaxID=1904254 RepID=UPI002721AAF9|nr:FAD-binding domain-containing protein [Hydrogenophaga sp.]MDO8903873.1 FAD-binding domain-containing protein [Hydrogenophaga sp.]
MTYRVVWFKRDLRVHDHAPLAEAARLGPVLCLYALEPVLWQQPDAARQHLAFVQESLRDLQVELKCLGGRLHFAVGDAVDVLDRLHRQSPFLGLFSHEESGNAASYERDRRVKLWCEANAVPWREYRQFGVVRGLRERKHWVRQWEQLVQSELMPSPALQAAEVLRSNDPWPSADSLGLEVHEPDRRQRGGRANGLEMLQSFLTDRSATYLGGISSPLSASHACSRLSPYLTWGCLSLREVVQAARLRMGDPALPTRQRLGLEGFMSRLHWHCHFIQKLETEPAIEHHNMHRGYDGLRESDHNEVHLQALKDGRTGWPLVDACVAMLRETGWINFRMRAMLVSVAAYPLWLHWRPVGEWLARQFLDYEPGIHWSQMQMQSGTTGINTTRVYNPIKQARDHDPDGHFVRHWLPAMQKVPDAWLFEPWRMPPEVQTRCGVVVGEDIAMPLVDLEQATREAKQRVYALRTDPAIAAVQADIVRRHGSRNRSAENLSRPRSPEVQAQASLDFS